MLSEGYMNDTPKPIVFFTEERFPVELGQRADLMGVRNHPALGDVGWVCTSKVVDVREGGRVIETLNTIYIRKEE